MVRKRKEDDTVKGAYWMDTYSDMVTLLLTFFVMLYSFSTVNENKWQQLVAAFTGSYSQSISSEDEYLSPNDKDYETGSDMILPDIDPLFNGITDYVKKSGLESVIEVTKHDLEIIIRFMDNVMFDSGKAEIKGEYLYVLDNIADVLFKYEDEISMVRIEGHTDNRPIHTPKYPSNWELSVNRAVAVLKYLIEEKNYDTSKISAVGYGEYHPIADNESESGRSKNRRVDFVITKSAENLQN